MLKLFDKAFFRMAFQFLFIVMVAFGLLITVGYLELQEDNDVIPEHSEAAAIKSVDMGFESR